MKKITLEDIKKLDPCTSGYENLVKYYPDFNMTMVEFLELEHIPNNDKEWLIRKMVDGNILKWWSLECAKSVAHIYNKKYPNDNMVNDCLKANKDFLLGSISLDELLIKRRAAYDAVGASDAYAADAAYSAYASSDAAYASTSDAAYDAAYAASDAYATYSSDAAYAAKKEQWNINFMLLICILEDEGE